MILEGLKVIELGTLVAAPFAGRILAEFGADVIKIEDPGRGDPLRSWRIIHNGTSLWWSLQARNKRCIAVDLREPEGAEIVKRLAAEADVLIENFRPGTLEKWGLGWDDLVAVNPDLTMVRISGYGQTGPSRDRPGFGAIGEAMGGIRYTTGDPERPPSRVGISLGDSLAALHAVIGALMNVYRVKTGRGRGQVVDVSLVESVFNLMESIVPEYDRFGIVRERTGSTLPGIAPSNTYPTADGGWVVIAGNGDAIFRRLMGVIGRPDLAQAPDLAHNDGRVRAADRLDAAIETWTRSLPLDAALAALEAAAIPAGRIYSVADIVRDPHFHARGMIQTATLDDGTDIAVPGIVPRFSETPGTTRWLGPGLGAHTRSVLAEAGFDEVEIDALFARGAVA